MTPTPVRTTARLLAGPPPIRPLDRDGFLDTARAALRSRPVLRITGPAGIGKSTLVQALADEARAQGVTTLRCAPGPDDSLLPYGALVDLLAPVGPESLARLPAEPRAALRAALLRGPEPTDGRDRLALRLAVVELLSGLTADGAPLLLVLDGVHWLDRPSAELLVYVAHRADPLGLRIVSTERSGEDPPPLYPPGTLELAVPPLSLSGVEQLLAQDAGPGAADLPVRLLRQIHEVSGGNPSYALALAPHHPGSRHPDDRHPEGRGAADGPYVPSALRRRLLASAAGLPPQTRALLLLAATAARPTLDLLRAAGVADPAAVLAGPERLGLVGTDADGAVRFGHPMQRAALLDDATTRERLAAHTVLAELVPDPVERARHLALATPYQDAALAELLSGAAASARTAGRPDTAYELAVLAVERTPAGHHADRTDRLLDAAGFAVDAGMHEEARRAAESVLATPAGPADPDQRVRARLVLLETAGQALGDTRGLIEAGLADAIGNAGLQARLRLWAAVRALLGGSTATAAEQAARAAELAALADDRSTRVSALGLLATVQAMRGTPGDAEHTLALALSAADSLAGPADDRSLMRRQALAELDADQVVEAHARITALLERSQARAGVEDSLATLVALVRVQVRRGECAQALATAERCGRLLTDADLPSPLAAYAAALAETAAGTLDRARAAAGAAVDGSTADGDRLFLIRALGALGTAQLLAGSPDGAAAAVESLQRARELGAAMELADPDTVRRLADLAEALALLGETAEAAEVLAEARSLTAGWTPPWGGGALAALERAEGLVQAALGRIGAAADALSASAERLRGLPLPLELVRTLIAWGGAERRARHRVVARAALTEAAGICRLLAAAPLLRRAEEELDRLSPGERVRTAMELTASEQRVADLVSAGATNREVAAALFVSVKTVEGTLSRVYRKLGVRSRTGLARAADIRGHELFTDRARDTPLMRGVRTS
ncbi:AAA family ATPase [Streptacidiphilus sp. N1-12]|uniref:AAA family ATPase n=2 Tax=Streptacidiphilus alkalitolerans TaxID=3342712 RepID=A0ABV6WI01_9ACTN